MGLGVILLVVALLMMTGALGTDLSLSSSTYGVSGIITFIIGLMLLGVGIILAEFTGTKSSRTMPK